MDNGMEMESGVVQVAVTAESKVPNTYIWPMLTTYFLTRG